MGTQFNKIVVARHSPKNKCHARDGAVLCVVPRDVIPMKNRDVRHHFVDVHDQTVTSQYGWVQEVAPFSLEDFTATYLNNRMLSESESEHLKTMFSAIMKVAPGSPVAATYSSRGVEKKRMVFTVHRVIFHKR